MRRFSLLALVACGENAQTTPDASPKPPPVVAMRVMDGPWQIIPTPLCGSAIDAPTDRPYEIVTIDSALDANDPELYVLRAGPGDGVRWPTSGIAAPLRLINCEEPDAQVPVALSAVDIARVSTGVGFGEISKFETKMRTGLGVQDVVAIPYDYNGGLGLYVLKRGVDITPSGFALDFSNESAAVEQRAVSVDGAIARFDASVTLRTAGGTSAGVWPEFPSGGAHTDPMSVSVIPDAHLIDGDRQIFSAVLYRANPAEPQPPNNTASFELDLRVAPSAPIVITVAPPIDSASCGLGAGAVTLAASTAAAWNESVVVISNPDDSPGSSTQLVFAKTRGWPGTSLGLPDLSSIPGWDPSWSIRFRSDAYGKTTCRFQLCEVAAISKRCGISTVPAS